MPVPHAVPFFPRKGDTRFLPVVGVVMYAALIAAPVAAAGDVKAGEAGAHMRGGVLPLKGSGILRGGVPATREFYCGDKIVAPGDTRGEVLAKCGEPAWQELREEGITETYLADGTPVNFVTTEEWVYNFGSDRFLRFLRFQGDRLAVIETGEYGYTEQEIGRNCEDGRNISPGDSKLEVFVKCGVPQESTSHTGENSAAVRAELAGLDRWTYNFGPDRFIYIVKFRRGRVYDVTTGGYGH